MCAQEAVTIVESPDGEARGVASKIKGNSLTRKIKVAFLIDRIYSGLGGTEKQLMETIQKLDKDTFDPSLICLNATSWNSTQQLPCKVFVLGYEGIFRWSFLRVIRRLIRLLNEQSFDILHTFFEESIFVAYAATLFSKNQPALVSSRRDIGLGGSEPWYHFLYRLSLPLVYRRFTGILANGNRVREYAMRIGSVPFQKVKIIPNGIALPVEMEPEPGLFRECKADIWIGVVANLRRIKRLDVFLTALGMLRDRHGIKGFGAVILGEGREKAELDALIHQLGLDGFVHFMGSVSNVIAYLQRMDVGVLCSDREGFSNAILEYMACSLPVVATSVGGNTELVDESNGICVPPADPLRLADALAKLAKDKDLRTKLGKQSRKKVEECYSWERTMKELENYYREVLSARKSMGKA